FLESRKFLSFLFACFLRFKIVKIFRMTLELSVECVPVMCVIRIDRNFWAPLHRRARANVIVVDNKCAVRQMESHYEILQINHLYVAVFDALDMSVVPPARMSAGVLVLILWLLKQK